MSEITKMYITLQVAQFFKLKIVLRQLRDVTSTYFEHNTLCDIFVLNPGINSWSQPYMTVSKNNIFQLNSQKIIIGGGSTTD